MPVIRTRVDPSPPVKPGIPRDENEPVFALAEPIEVVLRSGKWEGVQLQLHRIDDDTKARLEHNGFRYSRRLQKWWRPALMEVGR